MDTEERPVRVVVAPEAQLDLNEIWNWNARDRGICHADSYVRFLETQIDGLSEHYASGKVVGTRPDLRYILMRRKTRGHGHVAVYTVAESVVTVVYVFHTAQDWQATVAEE